MNSVYIKFTSEEDRKRGFYQLAMSDRISSLPGQIYQVLIESLQILQKEHIGFRRASDDEVKAAHNQVRNPSPTVL